MFVGIILRIIGVLVNLHPGIHILSLGTLLPLPLKQGRNIIILTDINVLGTIIIRKLVMAFFLGNLAKLIRC